jgi:arsenate reductase (glutaredoxin)
MQNLKMWHNISCSKSNSAKCYLDDNGIKIQTRNYLLNPPNKSEIKVVLEKLNLSIKDIIRDSEKLYFDLDIKNINDDELLLEILEKNPILIQRPILIGEKKAFIVRPPLKIEDILNEF